MGENLPKKQHPCLEVPAAQVWVKSAGKGRERFVEGRVAWDSQCRVPCLRQWPYVKVSTEISGNIGKQLLGSKGKGASTECGKLKHEAGSGRELTFTPPVLKKWSVALKTFG